jgi:hypothetical protein
MENYVGRKIRGFRFKNGTDGIYWGEGKEKYNGVIGNIVLQDTNSLMVKFTDIYLLYPISLVEQYLIEEESEISGLEALFIVHGGWHTEEEKVLYNKSVKIIQQAKERLQSIYIKTIPKYTHAELVEKLGHDFEIIK